MGSKRCFLIGHRSVPECVRSLLCNAIEQLIATYGVEEFYVGRYGQFDRMAAQALVDAKAIFPHIRLYLLTPYHPSERPISLPASFDGSHYPFERAIPRRVAIVAANRAMVDYCDYLIIYARHPGNARELLHYAQNRSRKCPLHILNLADFIENTAQYCNLPKQEL